MTTAFQHISPKWNPARQSDRKHTQCSHCRVLVTLCQVRHSHFDLQTLLHMLEDGAKQLFHSKLALLLYTSRTSTPSGVFVLLRVNYAERANAPLPFSAKFTNADTTERLTTFKFNTIDLLIFSFAWTTIKQTS